MIDVGGIALLRAAARNYAGVTVVADPRTTRRSSTSCGGGWRGPGDPPAAGRGGVRDRRRVRRGGRRVPQPHQRRALPGQLTVVLQKQRDLPYGENPHQRAAFYRETTHRTRSLADAVQIQGADPTFNDLLDLDAAYRIASDFTAPTCCIAKQVNPVGLASTTGRRWRTDARSTGTRSRRTARSSRSTASWTRRRRTSSLGRLRGGRGARLRGGGAAHPRRQARRCPAWPCPATPPGAVRLRHRGPRLPPHRGWPAGGDARPAGGVHAQLRVVTGAGPHARGAHRSAVRLARRASRAQQRGRAGAPRGAGGPGRRPGQPPHGRRDRHPPGGGAGHSAASRPTRTSRSPMRSSSPASAA